MQFRLSMHYWIDISMHFNIFKGCQPKLFKGSERLIFTCLWPLIFAFSGLTFFRHTHVHARCILKMMHMAYISWATLLTWVYIVNMIATLQVMYILRLVRNVEGTAILPYTSTTIHMMHWNLTSIYAVNVHVARVSFYCISWIEAQHWYMYCKLLFINMQKNDAMSERNELNFPDSLLRINWMLIRHHGSLLLSVRTMRHV